METKKKKTKMRQVVLRNLLNDARYKVIMYDLELSFIKNLKERKKTIPNMENLELEYRNGYNEYMEKLMYFKELKKIYEDSESNEGVAAIASEAKESSPENINVERK